MYNGDDVETRLDDSLSFILAVEEALFALDCLVCLALGWLGFFLLNLNLLNHRSRAVWDTSS